MTRVMGQPPDTRHSLIARLADREDAAAWDEFVAIYQPLVYRLARAKGFQDADASDLAQEVLLAVSRAVDRWVPDAALGRFRDWLFRIARNLMVNFLARKAHRPLGTGDSGMAELLAATCDRACAESAEFDLEYRRQVYVWSAEQVRRAVKPTTWQAFHFSTVEGRPIDDVARELRMTVGAVYIARSRVMARLRETARRFGNEEIAVTS